MVFKCWICTKCNVLTLSSYFSHFHEYLCWPQQFCIFYFFVRCYYLYILVKIYLGAHCFESAVSYSVSRESSKSYMVFIVTFLLGTLLSFFVFAVKSFARRKLSKAYSIIFVCPAWNMFFSFTFVSHSSITGVSILTISYVFFISLLNMFLHCSKQVSRHTILVDLHSYYVSDKISK